MCQATLNDFNLCMFYQPPTCSDVTVSASLSGSWSGGGGGGGVGDDEKPLYLDDELIFKLAVISMICIHFQRQMSESRCDAA